MVQSALVVADYGKEGVRFLGSELEAWLSARLASVRLATDVRRFREEREALSPEERARERPDLLVVLGGDGALLAAVRAFSLHPVPTLGINFGRVGFLASTPASKWRESLECVLAGACQIEQRTRLAVRIEAGGQSKETVALNDVALQRSAHQGMLSASLHVDGTWVTDYRADGVIVATPSGSTAYALSAGGPILEPSVPALVVTPICSHGLSNRPIVLHERGELVLRVSAASGITTVAVDGQSYHSLSQGDLLRLRRHAESYPVYVMPGLDPYRRLRERLGWSTSPLAEE